MNPAPLSSLRANAPLIHNITNFVVMNSTANALLAVGASTVMAHAREEVTDMTSLAGALVINIGTLSPDWVDAMHLAAHTAAARGIPIVLDPVGCGATAYRTETALRLIETARPTIIRGNASEILALAHSAGQTRGVDSTQTPEQARAAAFSLAQTWRCAVSVSGPVDLVVSNNRAARIHNGHPLMPRVTGMGCTASALSGAFAAICPDAFEAAVLAMQCMGVAGEIAGERASGPGSFQMHFLDALHSLQDSELQTRGRVEYADTVPEKTAP